MNFISVLCLLNSVEIASEYGLLNIACIKEITTALERNPLSQFDLKAALLARGLTDEAIIEDSNTVRIKG